MVLYGFKFDNSICRVLVFGYCKVLNIDKVEFLLVLFVIGYQLYDLDSCNLFFKIKSEYSGVIELMELQDKMLILGFFLNSLICKYVFYGLQNFVIKDKNKFK